MMISRVSTWTIWSLKSLPLLSSKIRTIPLI